MMQAAFLVQNGISLDVAMAMDPHEALAWAVMFGKLKGGNFNWSTLSWIKD